MMQHQIWSSNEWNLHVFLQTSKGRGCHLSDLSRRSWTPSLGSEEGSGTHCETTCGQLPQIGHCSYSSNPCHSIAISNGNPFCPQVGLPPPTNEIFAFHFDARLADTRAVKELQSCPSHHGLRMLRRSYTLTKTTTTILRHTQTKLPLTP